MESTVTDKGQITLPKFIRDQLGISPGTKLSFEIQSDKTLTVRLLSRGSAGLFGLLAAPGDKARSLDDMNEAVGAVVRQRAKRRG